MRLSFYIIIALLFSSCVSSEGRNYVWSWFAVSPFTLQGQNNLAFLLGGLWPTLTISLLAFTLSITLGLIIALIGFIPGSIFPLVNRGYVELFRSIPVVVMILWVYYGLPVSLGIKLDLFSSGVLALALCDSAFEAEIFRSGIQSITQEQLESARAIGLSGKQTMRYVILPQAIRRILPPMANQLIYMLKVSSLMSVIGYPELTRKANELTTIEYRPLEIYTILIVEYLVLIFIASAGVRFLEKKLRIEEDPSI